MSPSSKISYPRNMSVMDAEFSSQGNIGRVRSANFVNLKFSKLLISSATTFYRFINHIVLVTSKPQMIWTYTSWIIAQMTNKLIFWNWSEVQFPRSSMGISSSTTRATKGSITTVCRTNPFPTRMERDHNNFIPKIGGFHV